MNIKYTTKPKLYKSKGYPVTSRSFSKANSEADVDEKRKYPKGYMRLKKIESKMPGDEILGHHTRKGNVIVSRRVPKDLRHEVAQHEVMEHRFMRKKK